MFLARSGMHKRGMRGHLVAALVLLLVSGCGGGGDQQGEGKQTAAPRASATEKRDAALDKAIRSGIKRASVPGAIVGVWREGQPPYLRAFGLRDKASGEPMATDLHMRIGSNTKTFVVTSVLMLAEQGKLGLDDPIDRYVKGVPNGDRITLRQLAQMRSGLYDYSGYTIKNMPQQPFRQWTPHELLEIAFRHPPLFPPGKSFDYSNTNTVLLGLVVEKVSGQSLGSFIERNILEPEGMTQTVFPAGAEIPSPHSQGYFTDAQRQDRRRDRLESVMGLGVGQHDLDARRHARVDARPRHGQADLARHEARATTVLAGTRGRRRHALRAGAREPERLDRPQRQHLELHGLSLLSAVRAHDDGGDAELGRRYPGLVADDPGHHPDHQPQQRLARPAEGVTEAVRRTRRCTSSASSAVNSRSASREVCSSG